MKKLWCGWGVGVKISMQSTVPIHCTTENFKMTLYSSDLRYNVELTMEQRFYQYISFQSHKKGKIAT